MRTFENQVQLIKYEALKEVSRHAFQGTLKGAAQHIAIAVNPGPAPRYRCCLYHERATTAERVRMAQGGDLENPNIVEVLDTACDQCPVNRYVVTETCRGCLAHRCQAACPVDAISFSGLKASIDYSKCVECGRCRSACPYDAISDVMRPCRRACPTGALEINSIKKAVINNDKCIQCGACVYQCPFGALQDKSEVVDIIEMLRNAAEDSTIHPYAVIAPAFATQFEYARLGQVVRGIRMLGFRDVVEAALGADMVSEHEAIELVERLETDRYMTSSCCPAFVRFVRQEHPDQAGFISDSVSPMIATSLLIKAIDPQAVVVFIGPCIAKKAEKREPDLLGITDYVLTFEELAAIIDSKEICMETLEDAPLNNASYFGRMFAGTGGLTEAVQEVLRKNPSDKAVIPVVCDGIKECDKALKMAKVNRLGGNFIEGMACTGGCIKGPVTMHHGPKDKKALETYSRMAVESNTEDSLRVFKAHSVPLNRRTCRTTE